MKNYLILLLASFIAVNSHADVCGRTPKVVKTLEHGTKKKCELITEEDLLGLSAVEVGPYGMEPVEELTSGDFAGLGNLLSLEISETTFTTLPSDIFKGLTKLQSLMVFASGAHILALAPDTFHDLSSLEQLVIEVDFVTFGMFRKLTALKKLTVSTEDIYLGAGYFEGLTSLTHLRIESPRTYGPLKVFDSKVFSAFQTLKVLSVDGFNAGVLPDNIFSANTSLENLDVSSCSLTKVPESIFLLKNLKSLDLRFNKFPQTEKDRIITAFGDIVQL